VPFTTSYLMMCEAPRSARAGAEGGASTPRGEATDAADALGFVAKEEEGDDDCRRDSLLGRCVAEAADRLRVAAARPDLVVAVVVLDEPRWCVMMARALRPTPSVFEL